MIDELKIILDMVGDVTGIAAWLVGGFILYKFIIYASTAGAIVYLARLAIERLYSYFTREKIVKCEYSGHFIDGDKEKEFQKIIEEFKVSTGRYIHRSDIRWFRDAIKEKKENDILKKKVG